MIGFIIGLLVGAFSGFCIACLMIAVSETRNDKKKEDETRKFLTWLKSELPFDCYSCPVTVCFYDKKAKCVDELIKKYKEQGRQQS